MSELTPGDGNFYVVNIEAVADPTPPDFVEERSPHQIRAEIESLLVRMEGISEQEALDQVHRRVIIHLCAPCFGAWIENPAGS